MHASGISNLTSNMSVSQLDVAVDGVSPSNLPSFGTSENLKKAQKLVDSVDTDKVRDQDDSVFSTDSIRLQEEYLTAQPGVNDYEELTQGGGSSSTRP